jgi:quercetin dioxygenase-like cupin family protein
VQKYNLYTARKKDIISNYFTGKVNIREILGEENSSEQEMYHVTFYAGALTSLHYHEADQILIATKGQGVVGIINGDSFLEPEFDPDNIMLLNEHDTVCVPANIIHFHGALNREEFSHIAIMNMYKFSQSTCKRSTTKWEYDLLLNIAPNEKKAAEKFMMAAQEEIRERIQTAISKKLDSIA